MRATGRCEHGDEGPAGVAETVSDAGRLLDNLLGRVHHLGGALQGGRVGQLDVDDQPALVLRRNEPAGDASEAEPRQTN